MSLLTPERLYFLLPAVHRLRDAEEGEPLRALLGVIEAELTRVEGDAARLYDDWFIETCAEWAVPYIGDLLRVRAIRPIPSAGVSARAYVANTIAYRRRKGAAVALEELARDVTGWPARAVEFFQRLATAQHMNHVRLAPAFTAGIRNAAAAELADGAFDRFAHTADVRRIAAGRGRHNIPNVGLFLWRLKSYRLGSGSPGDTAPDFTSARNLGAYWSIHPAGVDAPLFNIARTETTITHLAAEENVPGRLRALALHAELERLRQGIAGPAPVFMTAGDPVLRVFVRLAGAPEVVEAPREGIHVCDLPDDVAGASPPPLAVAVDPDRGRLAFPPALPVEEVRVQSAYGFPGDLGGGPYDRSAAVRAANAAIGVALGAAAGGGFEDPSVWQAGVSRLVADDGGGTIFPTLAAAVAAWNALPPGETGVIVVMDSLCDTAGPVAVDVGEGSRLLVVAGTWPLEPIPGAPPGGVARRPGRFTADRVRAHLAGDLVVRGVAPAGSTRGGSLALNGLLLEGALVVAAGELGELRLAHATLSPGGGGLSVEPGGNARLSILVDRAILPSVAVAGPVARLAFADSLIGAGDGSPAFGVEAAETPAEFVATTAFGFVLVQSVNASDSIFAGGIEAVRRQTGRLRFSYAPPGSAAPRRYRCQPDLAARKGIEAARAAAAKAGLPAPTAAEEAAIRAEAHARIRPLFVSRRYGDPAFGQLELRCPLEIGAGAEDGAEMGAFTMLKTPQRTANLRDALDEYLRFGLEAGIIFVN